MLSELASEEAVDAITEAHQEVLRTIDPSTRDDNDDNDDDDDETTSEYDKLDPNALSTETTKEFVERVFGSEDHGVDDEFNMSLEDLKTDLGVGENDTANCLLFTLTKYRRKDGRTAWDKVHAHEFDQVTGIPIEGFDYDPQDLRWVQYAGLHSLIRKTFSENSSKAGRQGGVLLADEVGIGKTGQALGYIAWLNMVADLQEAGKRLPPIFGEHQPHLNSLALKFDDSFRKIALLPR